MHNSGVSRRGNAKLRPDAPSLRGAKRRSNPAFYLRRQRWIASLRSQRRGWGPSANTILRHCEELLRRSNAALFPQDGLLRFARNDVEGHLPTRYSVIASGKATQQSILSFVLPLGFIRSVPF